MPEATRSFLLVAMPFVTSSYLLLVRPAATSSVLATSRRFGRRPLMCLTVENSNWGESASPVLWPFGDGRSESLSPLCHCLFEHQFQVNL